MNKSSKVRVGGSTSSGTVNGARDNRSFSLGAPEAGISRDKGCRRSD